MMESTISLFVLLIGEAGRDDKKEKQGNLFADEAGKVEEEDMMKWSETRERHSHEDSSCRMARLG